MTASSKADTPPPPPGVEHEIVEPEIRPPWRRMLLFAVVVALLLAIVYFSPLKGYLGRWQEISKSLRGLGILAPLVLTLSIALLVAVGFPRLALCLIAGMTFGFWSGLLWAQLGTLLGNYAAFLVVRSGGREWAQHYLSRRGKLHSVVRQQGLSSVILARQLPLPGLLINLTCSFLPIRHREFLLGTMIGQLPQAIPFTLVGAGALENSFLKSAGLIGLAVAVGVLSWLALRTYQRRRA